MLFNTPNSNVLKQFLESKVLEQETPERKALIVQEMVKFFN
jgi:hypothetical protein